MSYDQQLADALRENADLMKYAVECRKLLGRVRPWLATAAVWGGEGEKLYDAIGAALSTNPAKDAVHDEDARPKFEGAVISAARDLLDFMGSAAASLTLPDTSVCVFIGTREDVAALSKNTTGGTNETKGEAAPHDEAGAQGAGEVAAHVGRQARQHRADAVPDVEAERALYEGSWKEAEDDHNRTALIRAAKNLIEEVDRRHDGADSPLRYTVPWAFVVQLRNAVERESLPGVLPQMPDRDDAGPFGRVFPVSEDNDGKPLAFGKTAIAMRNGGWLGSSDGFPMGAPALYSRERAERLVAAWNDSLEKSRHSQLPQSGAYVNPAPDSAPSLGPHPSGTTIYVKPGSGR